MKAIVKKLTFLFIIGIFFFPSLQAKEEIIEVKEIPDYVFDEISKVAKGIKITEAEKETGKESTEYSVEGTLPDGTNVEIDIWVKDGKVIKVLIENAGEERWWWWKWEQRLRELNNFVLINSSGKD